MPAAERISEPLSVALTWLGLINLVVAVFNLCRAFRSTAVESSAPWSGNSPADAGAACGRRSWAGAWWPMPVRRGFVEHAGPWATCSVGLWIMIIAWFLLNMAEASGRSYGMKARLQGIRARDLAEKELPMVAPATSVADWVHDYMIPAGNRAFFVGDRETVLGLVTLSDARSLAREEWSRTRVGDIMTPAESLISVDPDTGAEDILQLINEHKLNQVPVMEGSRVLGWIDRRRLLGTIEMHLELDD
jgi:CBS domain-containing protein